MALDLHDPWVLLGALAQTTSRVRLARWSRRCRAGGRAKFAREVTDARPSVAMAGSSWVPGSAFHPTTTSPPSVTSRRSRARCPSRRGAERSPPRSGAVTTCRTAASTSEPTPASHPTRATPTPAGVDRVLVAEACRCRARPSLAGHRADLRRGRTVVTGDDRRDRRRRRAGARRFRRRRRRGHPGFTVADYERAGATWLTESRWPDGDWLAELEASAERGPRPDHVAHAMSRFSASVTSSTSKIDVDPALHDSVRLHEEQRRLEVDAVALHDRRERLRLDLRLLVDLGVDERRACRRRPFCAWRRTSAPAHRSRSGRRRVWR